MLGSEDGITDGLSLRDGCALNVGGIEGIDDDEGTWERVGSKDGEELGFPLGFEVGEREGVKDRLEDGEELGRVLDAFVPDGCVKVVLALDAFVPDGCVKVVLALDALAPDGCVKVVLALDAFVPDGCVKVLLALDAFVSDGCVKIVLALDTFVPDGCEKVLLSESTARVGTIDAFEDGAVVEFLPRVGTMEGAFEDGAAVGKPVRIVVGAFVENSPLLWISTDIVSRKRESAGVTRGIYSFINFCESDFSKAMSSISSVGVAPAFDSTIVFALNLSIMRVFCSSTDDVVSMGMEAWNVTYVPSRLYMNFLLFCSEKAVLSSAV